MMERLSFIDDGGCAYVIHKYTRLYGEFVDRLAKYEDTWLMPETIEKLLETNKSLIEKLAKYREAEEQGLLVKLPCKVGTKVYYVGSEINNEINEWEYFVSEYGFQLYMVEELGKKYFLTKEEAEQKLMEIQEQIKDRF